MEKRNAIWVNHRDFDELMLLILGEFELDHPNEGRFKRLLDGYFETFKKLESLVKAKPESDEKKVIEEAAEKAAKKFKDWRAVAIEANKYANSDIERAEEIYKEGLHKFPDNANLLAGYAFFLAKIREDYDQAYEYCQKSLAVDPNNVISLSNYALLLKIRKDYERAEEYYQKTMAVDPNDANNLGNYAGFLLSIGNINKGEGLLTKVIELADSEALLLECFFYKYAHNEDSHQKEESLAKIKDLIQSGARSPGWNLQDNVKRAIEDGHPHPEFLETLAKVISEEVEVAELEKYDEWTKLSDQELKS